MNGCMKHYPIRPQFDDSKLIVAYVGTYICLSIWTYLSIFVPYSQI